MRRTRRDTRRLKAQKPRDGMNPCAAFAVSISCIAMHWPDWSIGRFVDTATCRVAMRENQKSGLAGFDGWLGCLHEGV
jgi:hypothetical protein